MSTTRFACDYAKRVAKCKKCSMQLPKGELRLAKITPNPFIQNAEGPPPDMKTYFHPLCLFETFMKARATTKVIEEPGDVEGWSDMQDEDKAKMSELIADLEKTRGQKTPSASKQRTPKRKVDDSAEAETPTPASAKKKKNEAGDQKEETVKKDTPRKPTKTKDAEDAKVNEASKFNSFHKFCKLCDAIGSVSKYTEKSDIVKSFLQLEGYDGDTLTWLKLLLPGIDQRVYNIKEKQIIKHFSEIYDICHEEMMDAYKDSGDVSQTIRDFVEKKKLSSVKKSDWSIQKVDRYLSKLTEYTKDEEQINHLKFASKRLSPVELQYLLRLIKKDLRFNAGTKHILDGLHPSAYEAFQNCRDLEDIVKRVAEGKLTKGSGAKASISAVIKLGTPVLPMLAEACKSVEYAMKKCSNGMYAEIKYDGERVQLHKKGDLFNFYSRSLKPVQDHKINHFSKHIPLAFPEGVDLILDAEVLMVDTTTGKPLPFGTLGVHKRENFKDAAVCLFVFDCLLYNDKNLMSAPLKERKAFLEKTLKEVKNHVMLSNYQVIEQKENQKLKTMIWKAIDEGLEGLVLKDKNSVYEPGKRHWLKVKKDYLEEGKMADTADLIVLGAYYGTGNKGGMMSVFLMGVYDKDTKSYRTVTKCGNGHTDEALERINKELKPQMTRIVRDTDLLPKWLKCSRSLCPDFVIVDPKQAPVWEITGAEFSRSDNHTAGGISIRFPRVTRIRDDKNWETATNLIELKKLFEVSKEKTDFDHEVDDSIPLYAKDEKSMGEALHTDVPKLDVVPDPFKAEEVQVSRKRKRTTSDEEDSESEYEKREHKKKAKKTEESDGESEEGHDGKPVCKFGKDCYRKNPEHKANFYHPKK